MHAPIAYSESALAAFMVVELGGIADSLGWVPGTPRVEYAVHDVARALNVLDVATYTDMPTLVAMARLSIWQAAEAALANRFHASVDGQSTDPQQQWDHAKEMVVVCEQKAAALGVGTAAISVDPVQRTEDPYGPLLSSGSEF